MRIPALILSCITMLTGCLTVDRPVFVDRQTMMEEDASGHWPDLEDSYIHNGVSPDPEPYDQIPAGGKKRRVYNILDSDLSRSQPRQGPSGEKAQ